MTTIEKPREAELSVTGYCKHRNHKKCPYRPGGACENGITLSDGGFYMCPCDCHAEQATAVKLKAKRLAKPAAPEPEWSGLKGTDSPNYYGPVQAAAAKAAADNVVLALDNNRDELEAVIEKQATPAKSRKPKRAADEGEMTKLGNTEKQAVRQEMAVLLKHYFSLDNFPALDGTALEGVAPELILAYVEDRLRYIDPDLSRDRRMAARARRLARKAK